MNMTSVFLCRILKDYNPVLYGEEKSFELCQYCLLSEASGSNSQCCAYISKLSELLSGKVRPAACAFIAVKDCEAAELSEIGVPVLVLETSASESEVFSFLLRRYFEDMKKCEDFRSGIIKLFSERMSIDSVLAYATEKLCNPLVIFDSSYSVVSCSNLPNLDIPDWQSVVGNSYANVDVLSSQSKDGLLRLFHEYSVPTTAKMPNGYYETVTQLFGGSENPALLVLYSYLNDFTECDYDCVLFLANMIESSYLRSAEDLSFKSPSDVIFDFLINGDGTLPQQFIDKADVKFPPKMRLMLIKPYDRFHTVPYKFILKSVGKLFAKAFCYENSKYVFLLCRDSALNEKSNPAPFEGLHAFLSEHRLAAGISNAFCDICAFCTAMREAEAALELGIMLNTSENVFCYVDYIVNDILNVLNEHANIFEFCHPALKQLIEYDSQYSTFYAKTLEAYLSFSGDMNKCAEKFSLHYNSIKYRINIIQNICDIDLHDAATFTSLYISYLILNMYSNKGSGFTV